MADVANQQELLEAISNKVTDINITAGFMINVQLVISYPVKLQGTDRISQKVLCRGGQLKDSFFFITGRGELTLTNLILDGRKEHAIPCEESQIKALITVKEGKAVLNGAVLKNNHSYSNGGGVLLIGNLAACILANQSMIQGCQSNGGGGGIYLGASSTLQAQDSMIFENKAVTGGGIYGNGNSCITLNGCLVSQNAAISQFGGGAYIKEEGAAAEFINCKISENYSKMSGGAVYGYSGARIFMSDCVIEKNHAVVNGGGAGLDSSSHPTSLILKNTVIKENVSSYGGGIWGNGSGTTMIIEDCDIQKNQSKTGAGIQAAKIDSLKIKGTSFTENRAANFGGGLCLQDSGIFSMENVVITGNMAQMYGGGLYVNGNRETAQIQLVHCKIGGMNEGNKARFGGGCALMSAALNLVDDTLIEGNEAKMGVEICQYPASGS